MVFFIRGCDELQEVKALNAASALELMDASQEEIEEAGLVAGFCGPAKLPKDILFFIDNELKDQKEMIVGANEKDYHIIGFSVSSFKDERFKDLVAVNEGDYCPKCGAILKKTKGIEAGHIFKLGQKYSKPMNATFLDKNGKTVPFFMGCYGIGVTRLIAIAVQSSHDEKGIIWNEKIAPFKLQIIISNIKDENQVNFANEIYEKCENLGIKTILDDRDERFGVKMNDYELIGFPYALIVGKNLANGEVEFIKRDGLIKEKISKNEALNKIKEILL